MKVRTPSPLLFFTPVLPSLFIVFLLLSYTILTPCIGLAASPTTRTPIEVGSDRTSVYAYHGASLGGSVLSPAFCYNGFRDSPQAVSVPFSIELTSTAPAANHYEYPHSFFHSYYLVLFLLTFMRYFHSMDEDGMITAMMRMESLTTSPSALNSTPASHSERKCNSPSPPLNPSSST